MIGETRWWSKEAALNRIFGSDNSHENCLYIDIIVAFQEIIPDLRKPEQIAKAKGNMELLLKYETLLTAFIFIRIFNITGVLSRYLQTEGMDLLKADQLVAASLEKLQNIQRDMTGVTTAVNAFIEWANDEICKRSLDIDIEDHIPIKRAKHKKKWQGKKTMMKLKLIH